MGKNKPNAYTMFIKDEFRRMQRAGEDPVFTDLFRELSGKWQSLPDHVRQKYKDRASGSDFVPSPYGDANRSQTSSTSSSQQTSNPESQPNSQTLNSTSNAGTSRASEEHGIKNEFKVKLEPDIKRKIDVDSKPVIKDERGEKRSLELEVYRGPLGQQHSERKQQEEEQYEHQDKRPKRPPGYGVPNWKNIKNSTQPDADRYFDYHMVELRNTCQSIVATRANKLMTMPLYTFSCNVLCKYKKDGKTWKFIPLEIGIYCYSIEQGGLGKPYSVIIDSGEAPRNYLNDSKNHSMQNHKIGFKMAGGYPVEARSDYRTIYKEMCKYTRAGERTILVADHRDLFQVRSSIEWIYEKASAFDQTLPKPTTWTILPLVEYIAATYNFVYQRMLKSPTPRFTLYYYLKVRLESSLWDYEEELMCQFHRRPDNQTKWCAQNCAIRVIKCLESVIEEIYTNYKLATEQSEAESDGNRAADQTQPAANVPPLIYRPRPPPPAALQPSTELMPQPLNSGPRIGATT